MISQDKYHDIIPTQNEYYLKIFKAAVSELWIYRGIKNGRIFETLHQRNFRICIYIIYMYNMYVYIYIYVYIYNKS